MDNLLATSIPIQYSLSEVILNLLLAVILGVAIAWVYKRTHKGVSYSQSFVISIALVAIITATVIMVIGNNLARAFGLIGAFAVIRFRTAVKDTRDIAFLFFSLVEGMAAGSGNFKIAAVAYLIFTLTIFALTKGQFGKFSAFDYLVSFHTKTKRQGKVAHLKLFDQYLIDHLLVSMRSTNKTNEMRSTYNIRFKDDDQIKNFLAKLKKTGASNIELISSQNDVDY